MKQLLTRVPDELHKKLRARAKATGESMNSQVVTFLADSLAAQDRPRERIRKLAESKGLLAQVPAPLNPETANELSNKIPSGFGAAVLSALESERSRS